MHERLVTLTIQKNGKYNKSLTLEPGITRLGRADDNDICLADIGVSRRHARIVVADEGVIYEDSGSGNGSWINNQRVQSHQVMDGDEISIEPFTLKFNIVEAIAEATDQTDRTIVLEEPPPPDRYDTPACPEAWLELTTERGAGQGRYDLPAEGLTLGRAEQRDVVLDDPAASRLHAEIVLRGGRFWIRDSGSANGLAINGRRVQEHPLTDGDQIRIGATEFRYVEQPQQSFHTEVLEEGPVERTEVLPEPPEPAPQRAAPGAGALPVGDFGADNRAGIEGTLHRISAIRNRAGVIIGLTLRVGRAVSGTIGMLYDLVAEGRSLLLLGPPGSGKTTRLREMARVLADELGRRVVVVDTSNEIAGDGDVPHPAIGRARRMQVAHPGRQHGVMIEAVENHMPEVIVIDEIGTEAEALAARTIAERGVQLIATAHGGNLENLVRNPTLADLVGGVQTVTLGDEEARLRGTPKTISERKSPPSFDVVVEIIDRDQIVLHRDAARAVDAILRGRPAGGEAHPPAATAAPGAEQTEPPASRAPTTAPATAPERAQPPGGLRRIYAHALSRDSVDRVIRDLRLPARTVGRMEQADMVLALRSRAEDPRLRALVRERPIPVHAVKKNSTAQIRRLLQGVFHVVHGIDPRESEAAAREAEEAVQRALETGESVVLGPQPPALRRLQHRIASSSRVIAESVGHEPQRHLVVHPHAFAALADEDLL